MKLNIWCDNNTCDSKEEYRVTFKELELIYSDNCRAYSHDTATVSLWHKDEFFAPIATLEVSRNYMPTEAAQMLISELMNNFENISSTELNQFIFMVKCFEAWHQMEYPAQWF